MFQGEIHWVAVIVAAAAAMVIGAVWYGGFSKPWAAAIGMKENEMRAGAGPGYAVAAVGALVTSFVIALLAATINADTAGRGALLGLILGVGLVGTHMATRDIFARRPRNLFLIDTGDQILIYVIIGLIIGAWQ